MLRWGFCVKLCQCGLTSLLDERVSPPAVTANFTPSSNILRFIFLNNPHCTVLTLFIACWLSSSPLLRCRDPPLPAPITLIPSPGKGKSITYTSTWHSISVAPQALWPGLGIFVGVNGVHQSTAAHWPRTHIHRQRQVWLIVGTTTMTAMGLLPTWTRRTAAHVTFKGEPSSRPREGARDGGPSFLIYY